MYGGRISDQGQPPEESSSTFSPLRKVIQIPQLSRSSKSRSVKTFQSSFWIHVKIPAVVYVLPKPYVDNRDFTGLTKVAENKEAVYP